MTIHRFDESAAVARLNSIQFCCPIEEVATRLAHWAEQERDALLAPHTVNLAEIARKLTGGKSSAIAYRERAKLVRAHIAEMLELDTGSAHKLTFQIAGRDAWYLGPRQNRSTSDILTAVRAAPEKYIELMLQRELLEEAAFDAEHVFVKGGFGPAAYLGSLSAANRRTLHLAEASFQINKKFGFLLCNVVSKVFLRKTGGGISTASSATLPFDAGEGFLMAATRLSPGDFTELDAREHPMVGISLDVMKVRRSRLYYLNLVTEFAARLFEKAGVPVEHRKFIASHYVEDAYIPLQPLANLCRPLILVNATAQELTAEALKPLERLEEFLPAYHTTGNRKAHFSASTVETAAQPPNALRPGRNYLFLNDARDPQLGSVRLASLDAHSDWKPSTPVEAYNALEEGRALADPYTTAKFHGLLNCDTVSTVSQGLDYGPQALASLRPDDTSPPQRQLKEALKRCLVELSLKECLVGAKALPTPAMPDALLPCDLVVIATRQIRITGKREPKQLVAVLDITLGFEGIAVRKVRRSPWSRDKEAAIDFVSEFDFLQENGKDYIRDRQFWVIDTQTQHRMTVWSGDFVPKLILNDDYPSIELALASQDEHLEARRTRGSKARYLSKGREFNLLPYYMSMHKRGRSVRGERTGRRLAIEDCGRFVRAFVPPEGGINGSGDALSCVRDIVLFTGDGDPVTTGLLEYRLIQTYLHTLTNGILVGGDNSKMSVLEKLARLALEN